MRYLAKRNICALLNFSLVHHTTSFSAATRQRKTALLTRLGGGAIFTIDKADKVTRTRYNGQVINDNGGDVSIRDICPSFQGQISFGPFLSKIGYLIRHLVPVLIHLEIGTKSDLDYFNCSVSPRSDDTTQWYRPSSTGAHLQMNQFVGVDFSPCN